MEKEEEQEVEESGVEEEHGWRKGRRERGGGAALLKTGLQPGQVKDICNDFILSGWSKPGRGRRRGEASARGGAGAGREAGVTSPRGGETRSQGARAPQTARGWDGLFFGVPFCATGTPSVPACVGW